MCRPVLCVALHRCCNAEQVRYLTLVLILACAYCFSAGCVDIKSNDETRTTMRQRQDAALQDPFSVEPDQSGYDVSGGDIRTLDRKALKRDLDTVFNP
jgi:hypothetical protein